MKKVFGISLIAMLAVTNANAVIVSQENIVGAGTVSVDVPTSGVNNGKVVITGATIGDGVLTVQRNGTTVDTFDANATANKTINIVDENTTYAAGDNVTISGADNTITVNAVTSTTGIAATAGASDTSFPTEKAVATALAGKQNTIPANTYDAFGAAATAEQNAKDYADGLAGDYATAAQGALADSALQKADIDTGTANGKIKVADKEVSVHGLKSGAYADAYTLPDATTTVKGGVIVGSNIDVSGGTISVADAASNTKGVMKLTSGTTNTTAENVSNKVTATTGMNTNSTTQYPSMATAQSMIEDTLGGYVSSMSTTINSKQPLLVSGGTNPNVVSSGDGDVVTNVSATNGVVTVTKGTTLGSLATKSTVVSADITDGTIVNADIADGTIAKAKLVSGVQTSLGLADSALQKADIDTGTANGKIKVADKEVAVYGLKSGAYADAYTLPDATTTVKGGMKLQTTTGTGTDGTMTQKAITDALAGKQATISDLETIRSNATAGKGASDTIGTYGNIVTHNTSEFAASSHNQASSTINAMTGYTKPSSTSAIATTDTLNAAIGKLEKALDGKQASGNYASSSQGSKADSAIQSVKVNGTALTADANKAVNVTVGTGSANGTISVNGSDVAVKGLGSGAYADAYTLPDATTTVKGGMKLTSGTTNTTAENVSNKVTATTGMNTNSTTQYPSMATAQSMIEDTLGGYVSTLSTTIAGKQPLLVSGGNNPNVVSSGSGNVVTNVSATNGVVTVTKGRVEIPSGSETANSYATIWVE